MYALLYLARQQGHNRLGLHPIPVTQVSEQKGKEAIQMTILLTELSKSQFSNEPWTLTDTNADLVLHTEPKTRFKKQPYMVTVLFDDDVENSNVYTNWDYIYYVDADDMWQKTEGRVSHDGLYYVDNQGEEVYYLLFATEANKYSRTGRWTVRFKNTTISSSVTSSRRTSEKAQGGESSKVSTSASVTAGEQQSPGHPGTSSEHQTQSIRLGRRKSRPPESPTSTSRRGGGRGLRFGSRRQGERRGAVPPEGRDSSEWSAPTADEVGERHRSVPRTGLPRLRRLQEEARDPPILIVTGPPNTLKCYRYRCQKTHRKLFKTFSTVWKWVDYDELSQHRMLVAFESVEQRKYFVNTVPIPRSCTFAYGYLDRL